MNTLEIKKKGLVRSFKQLFRYAKAQFLEYERLEGIADWEAHDFSIDCAEDQMRFKDMLQIRFVEELTEATHALDNRDHFIEEMADALNFFLSAYCMLGWDLSEMDSPEAIFGESKGRKPRLIMDYHYISYEFYQIVDRVGYLCNLLKNRPWAQSNYLVSLLDFEERAKVLWSSFWGVLRMIGFTEPLVFDMFERKYLVNKWRIKTGY